MAIDDLIKALQEDPNLEASTETLLPFVDGPEFFERWFRAVGGSGLGRFKHHLYENEGSLLELIRLKKDFFKVCVDRRYNTIDNIKVDQSFMRGIGVPKYSVPDTAKVLIDEKFLSGDIPYGHSTGKPPHITLFFDENAVGIERKKRNIARYVGWTYTYLTEIGPNRVLSTALRCPDNNTGTLAATLVQENLIPGELPDELLDLPVFELRWYFDPKVVKDLLPVNIRKYVSHNVTNLDEIAKMKGIGTALGCDGNSRDAIARAIVNRYVSGELPDGYSVWKRGHPSRYIDSLFVGEDQRLENLKKFFQTNFLNVSDVTNMGHPAINKWFSLDDNSVWSLRNKIRELGWLHNDDFRSYACSTLPVEFRTTKGERIKVHNGLLKKPIGAYNAQKKVSTTLPKGDALEQLFGLVASYANSSELVIPQYCLDVKIEDGKGYFGTRVDFRIGNKVYEVKWGKATENIMETYHKHAQLLTRSENTSLEYELIALDVVDSIGIPYKSFCEYLESNLGANVRYKFETLAAMLLQVSEGKNDPKSVDFLIHFRDYVYNLVDEANNKKGDKRKKYIEQKITDLSDLAESTDHMDEYLRKHTNRFFAPLEAHFEYKGVIYRGFITPPELQKEKPDRYETRYYFGDLEFTRELDRDVAILLECSPMLINTPAKGRVDKIIDHPKKLQSNPLFKLPNGMNISTNGYPGATIVKSLSELKQMVGVPDDLYKFARAYIRDCGLRC